MNGISLDEEEEEGLALDEAVICNDEQLFSGNDAKLCVERFISEGQFDFQAMQQTLAALWKPGRDVYIKDL